MIRNLVKFFVAFLFVCLLGAISFSAGGMVWGTDEAGGFVSFLLFTAVCMGGFVVAISNDR